MKAEHANEAMGIEEIPYRVGSGNVFADLGVDEPAEALLKADLARQIGAVIRERGLTQTEAASLLGVDQPKVSALLRGRLTGFSMDRLVRYAASLDQEVEVVVRPRAVTSSDDPRSANGRQLVPAGGAA
jgi:predicted XRE-type DNA-binding protein